MKYKYRIKDLRRKQTKNKSWRRSGPKNGVKISMEHKNKKSLIAELVIVLGNVKSDLACISLHTC